MRTSLTILLAAATLPWVPAASEAQSLGEVFKRVNSSVVIIRTKEREVAADGRGPVSVPGLGSGVLISTDGKVLTAAHVVHTADTITVEFLGGAVVGARVVSSEPQADVSLLQLERVPPGAFVATLGDSDAVEVGDRIFIVGAPYGIGHTLTVGHISARHQPSAVYSGMSLAEFFQTDAAINQGNSGGPMFGMAGEVVGIVSHIISKSGGFEGLGFVVTSNMARRLLIERKSFWSGLDGFLLSGDLAKALNVPQPAGLLVQRVAQDSPAASIGLRAGTMTATIDGQTFLAGGDIILEVAGIPIGERASYEKVLERLGQLHPGTPITITVLREGRTVELIGKLP